MSKVVIIGGGAAGMMAAVSAAGAGHGVTIYEKNEKLGKKIFITGKGRCNITNACDTEELFQNVIHNPKFLYSSFYAFTNFDMMDFMEQNGCPIKTERGNRVFPVSDKSSDVIRALTLKLRDLGVDVCLHEEVQEILTEDGRVTGIVLKKGGRRVAADAVIVATGGLSYPTTGSTGDGYRFAKELGHKVTSLSPGPVLLSASSYVAEKLRKEPLTLSIDLKPALSEEQLDARILRDFEEMKNKQFKNSLVHLLPAKMVPVIVDRSNINPDKKVNEITREERHQIVKAIKDFRVILTGLRDYKEAIITQGGVSVREVNPSTMESKLVKGLYFAGEVLDLDAVTGGFNLQIAWSTGYLAGISIE